MLGPLIGALVEEIIHLAQNKDGSGSKTESSGRTSDNGSRTGSSGSR